MMNFSTFWTASFDNQKLNESIHHNVHLLLIQEYTIYHIPCQLHLNLFSNKLREP